MRCLAWGLLLHAAQACADGGDGALDILLTNDDGWDSPGITAVAAALTAAGHRVTVVAPLTQQSGTGMKITLGEIAVTEQRPGVWSVDGSPADAVGVGLQHVMRDAPPDLVVSGANFGQNLGNNVMISGTVGAAMMAVIHGVPAVAVSVGLDLAEASAEPRFASTVAAFPGAASFTARLVGSLAARRDGGLLPAGQIVNVNYPAVAKPAGVVWARVSKHGGFAMRYDGATATGIKTAIEHDADGQAEAVTDTGRFAAGYVTLSVLTPDWNAPDNAAAGARARIEEAALLTP
ncbi:MAG: 5'/3'-nucleotidase SurE [Gammaproteobacteria bacterium]